MKESASRFSKVVRGVLVPLALFALTDRAESQERTSEFRIPLIEHNIAQRDFSSLLKSIGDTRPTFEILPDGNSIVPVPFGYTEMCDRIQAKFEELCKVIENPVNVYTELNEITFNVINSVKQAVQKSIIPMDDIVLYKKKEHWATNRYFPYGDCEENVRMNYSFLLQNGFLPENLNVAFVTVNSLDNTKQPEGHLVLLVTLMLKDRPVTLVVDNLQQRVIPISQATHLTFYSMLTSDRKRWVNIRVKN